MVKDMEKEKNIMMVNKYSKVNIQKEKGMGKVKNMIILQEN